MPRRKKTTDRKIIPDAKYGDQQVSKFINYLMQKGKKSLAEKIFYSSMETIEDRQKKPGLEVFKKAIKNVSPIMEVKSRRIGGATYQVPVEVDSKRRFALASRWIITHANKRSGGTMADQLADELLAASNNEGGAIRKKEETHRMAEANKAFAHFG